jgi:hypothetical protein
LPNAPFAKLSLHAGVCSLHVLGKAFAGAGPAVKSAGNKQFPKSLSLSILPARIRQWLGRGALLAVIGVGPEAFAHLQAGPLPETEPAKPALAEPVENPAMRFVRVDPQGRVELDLRLSDDQLNAALLLM